MAINFNHDRAFILKRTHYREQHYLLDLFHCELGRFKAIARIVKTTTYRLTDRWALFQEILVDGHRKSDLATIWACELYRPFPLSREQQIMAYYLNELLLSYLPTDDPSPVVYKAYIFALSHPSKQTYRQLEYQLIEHLGLTPQIDGSGEYYLLTFQHSVPILSISSQGFDGKLVQAIQSRNIEVLTNHSQTKSLFQQILHHQHPFSHKTRNISQQLYQISHK